MLGQVLAHHLRIPGIVVLLLLGVVLGPDVLDLVRPRSIGGALPMIVELAVAIILFEGGLSLNLSRLGREVRTIRALITVGALVTAVGASLAAHLVMGWAWPQAVLFGTLVIVTGPTVITPLVRRIRLKRNLETILEAEGVLIDPIGAVVAVVALEVVVAGIHDPVSWPVEVVTRLGAGVVLGSLGGLAIALLLRIPSVVPDALRNILALSSALAVFELSNAVQHESGIMAVVAAGAVVGNVSTGLTRELMEFKEQLTMLMIGLLFVLLAADVRVDDVRALGLAGLATIGLLMFVVRPLAVAVSTTGPDLTLREKAFLSWLSPRGIVAAAVASLFAQSLAAAGIPGGTELRALVFLVIALTVVVQGLTGGMVATFLDVRRPRDNGYAIVGAGPLGRALAGALTEAGHEIVLVDRNPVETRQAEEAGLSVVFGDATDESVLRRADIECRRGFIAVTTNDAVNVLVAQHAQALVHEVDTMVAVNRQGVAMGTERIQGEGHRILFGQPVDLERWNHHLLRGTATVEAWRLDRDAPTDATLPWLDDRAAGPLLALAHESGDRRTPLTDRTTVRPDDIVVLATIEDQAALAHERLAASGWSPVVPDAAISEAVGEASPAGQKN